MCWKKMHNISYDFFDFLASFVKIASYNQLKTISKMANQEKNERYNVFHGKKVEIERGLTDDEFLRFMDVVDDPIDRLCFLLIATLGLRPNELERLKIEGNQLHIPSSKGGYASTMPLPPWLLNRLHKVGVGRLRSQKALRDRFRVYRNNAGLDEVYMRTLPCGRFGSENRRFRITIYSLRHYAIQRFYLKSKDLDLTRRFARHRHTETTEVYLKTSRKEEIEQIVSNFPMVLQTSTHPFQRSHERPDSQDVSY